MRFETDFKPTDDNLSIHEWLFSKFTDASKKHKIDLDNRTQDIHVKLKLTVMRAGEEDQDS